MISASNFGDLSQKDKFSFIIKVLDQVEPQGIFDDLRQLFRVVKNPSENMLIMVFEIIEGMLNFAKSSSEKEKTENLHKIRESMRKMKDLESEERLLVKQELEGLIGELNDL